MFVEAFTPYEVPDKKMGVEHIKDIFIHDIHLNLLMAGIDPFSFLRSFLRLCHLREHDQKEMFFLPLVQTCC